MHIKEVKSYRSLDINVKFVFLLFSHCLKQGVSIKCVLGAEVKHVAEIAHGKKDG